jgi:predicted heme/steroid binding protein
MKKFDEQDLTEYDDRDGKPVFIARDGKVYDVSASKLWKGSRQRPSGKNEL